MIIFIPMGLSHKTLNFLLNHGLPQGYSLSLPLYLIDKNFLLKIAEKLDYTKVLGFINYVLQMASANEPDQVKSHM